MKRNRYNNILCRAMLFAGLTTFFVMLQGCDGCSCVKGKVKGDINVNAAKTSGSAVIVLTQLNKIVASGEKKFVTVSFSGSQSSDAEGTGETSFTTSKTIEVTEGSINPQPIINRYNMKPGTWTIKVSAGTWSSTCSKNIEANKSTTFTFTFNNEACK
jgi:hypothetical protein